MTRRSTERLPVAVVATVTGAIVAVMVGRPDAVLLVAPWTVLLVLGLPWARRQRIEATIDVESDRVLVGDDVVVTTTVVAETGSVQVSCRPSAGFHGAGTDGRGPSSPPVADLVDPGRPTAIRCVLLATAWGTHDVGRAQIDLTEPYGLFRWSQRVNDLSLVRVHPQPREIRQLLAPWLVRRLAGAHDSRAVERGVEFADIRPFTAGDSLRDINWRASARASELWVSQRHPDRATDVVLLLDSFVESGHDARTVVGLAIEAAVGLAESHLALTDRVGLIELGGVVRWVSPGSGRLQLQRLIDALLATGLYANAADRDLTVIPPRALPPRSFVVALSPLLDSRFIDALFVLRGQGHDVAVIDCAPAVPDPGDDQTESARLAHQLWLAERGMVRDRLAEQGILVGRWDRGEHLDLVLVELGRRRHRARWASAR